MLNLNYRDSKPIYEQIKEQIKKLVVSDAMKEDEKLPSVREMASGMSINPNTIQRAYRELETEGFIYSIPGKGSFVASKQDVGADMRYKLFAELQRIIEELKFAGADLTTVVHLVEKTYGERKG